MMGDSPDQNEIDEVLSFYKSWLDEEYKNHGDRGIAIGVATERAQDDSYTGHTFSWLANNDASLIYDVDESLKDDILN